MSKVVAILHITDAWLATAKVRLHSLRSEHARLKSLGLTSEIVNFDLAFVEAIVSQAEPPEEACFNCAGTEECDECGSTGVRPPKDYPPCAACVHREKCKVLLGDTYHDDGPCDWESSRFVRGEPLPTKKPGGNT